MTQERETWFDEYIAHKARDLLAPLRLGEQPTQYLHPSDVVPAQFLGQQVQWHGGARISEGGERIVTTLANPLVQAHLDVALPRTPTAHRVLQRMNFIGIL